MPTTSTTLTETPLVTYVLRRADDALILGHRLSEWTGHAPMLEEELALANLGLDLIGQARTLYQYAAECADNGQAVRQSEDTLAYLRDARAYRNCLLVEQPNGDFATTMIRHLLYATFADLYWRAMVTSKDATLAAIAAKAEKEMAYHVRHAADWVVRLGDGTAESHRRCVDGLFAMWPFVGELFEVDPLERGLVDAGIAVDCSTLATPWRTHMDGVFGRATLSPPTVRNMQTGGRAGRHSEHLGHLLAVMQSLPRTYPGATW